MEKEKATEQKSIPKAKEKTLSETFMEELNEQEKNIFLKIKSVRIDVCEYEEFEAVTEESLEDYVQLITYVKAGKVRFEDDGVVIKIRRPILSEKGEVITEELKLLYQRNEARERAFTKKIKLKPGDTAASLDYTKAVIAANLANVSFGGGPVVIPVSAISGNKMHQNDYILLRTCFDFFRN